MTLKRKVIFELNKRGKAAEHPIRMRLTYAGERIDFSMGFNIDQTKWDADAQIVRNGCTNKLKQTSTEINKHLSVCKSTLDKIFQRYEVDSIIPTIKMVKDAYYAIYGKKRTLESKPNEIGFFQRFDEFVKDRGTNKNWTDATYTKFKTVRSHLEEFDPNLSFDALTEEKLLAYVVFLQTDKKEVSGMRNSTISKQLGFLKWFLRWATSKHYNSQIAYSSFSPNLKSVKKEIVYLEWEELINLYNLEIPVSQQYLERVRDVFCFCCFTSLRYSDAYNLKRSDIKNGALHITTIKTNDKLTIQLNDYSTAILEKYKDIQFIENKALPVISNQKMNEYLKVLGEKAKLNDPVTDIYFKDNERKETVYPKWALLGTHAGRRTFICNALAMDIPAQVVMKWTGHSDYKAMQPYIDVAEKVKAEAMNKFNEKKVLTTPTQTR